MRKSAGTWCDGVSGKAGEPGRTGELCEKAVHEIEKERRVRQKSAEGKFWEESRKEYREISGRIL